MLASKQTEQGAAVTENTAQSVVVLGLLDQKFLSTSVDFEFFFSEVLRPPNDSCDEALEIELFDTVGGSNLLSAVDDVADCGVKQKSSE